MEDKGFIRNLMDRFATTDDRQIAFSIYDGNQLTDITYHQFLHDVLKIAGYFAEKKIRNQHVALAAPNSYEWLVVFFAILTAGNSVVLLNPDLSVSTLQQQCGQSDVSVACVKDTLVPQLCNNKSIAWITYADMGNACDVSLDDVWEYAADDTVIMLLTSGTTGKSKIVEYTAYNVVSYMHDLNEVMSLPDKMLAVLPMHHISGLASILYRLFNLQHVCLNNGIQYLLRDLPILNPSHIFLVPSILESIVKLLKKAKNEEERRKYIGNNLKNVAVGGTSVRPELCLYLMELGIEVQSGYGMTETMGGTFCVLNEKKVNTIGRPFGRTQFKIADGELMVKGPIVMKGYYKDPEATAEIMEDGWIHTGDIAYCDEDGDYFIVGRKKNVIILSNGENVNPEEIEAKWGSCEHILECMVYSDGKGICADVYTENKEAAAAYIKEYNYDMPMYRQVYKVNYSAEPLEKTSTGKIKRKENK